MRTFTFQTPDCGKFSVVMDLDMNNTCEAWIARHFDQWGVPYEPEVSCTMAKVVRRGDSVVDVGANVGYFTLFLSQLVGPQGKVWSFEPDPKTLLSLRRNLGLNNTANVKLVERPLWHSEESVVLYHDEDSGGGGTALWDPGLWPDNALTRERGQPQKMMATTLDQCLGDLFDIRLIKLDTEGTEQKILEGAKKLLAQTHPPFIITELNPFGMQQMGCSNETFRNFMAIYGYSAFFLHRDGSLPSLVPSKTKIVHARDIAVFNVLFSTVEAVGEAWPVAPSWGPND